MNTPQIKFMGIRFLRLALKNQSSLTQAVLQNRQDIDLLIPEHGGTWAILNETCFQVNSSNQIEESLIVLKKNIQVLQDLKKWAVEFSGWLQSLFGGSFSWWGGIWSWLMPLLIPVIIIDADVPCIINCLIHFVCPDQQATTTSSSSTRIYKTTPDHSPEMDTAIRTLRLETSKKGKPNAPCHSSSAGGSQRDLNSPTSKELGLPSLEGGMLSS